MMASSPGPPATIQSMTDSSSRATTSPRGQPRGRVVAFMAISLSALTSRGDGEAAFHLGDAGHRAGGPLRFSDFGPVVESAVEDYLAVVNVNADASGLQFRV